MRSHLELGNKKTPRRFLEWIGENLPRFSAWGIVLFLIAAEDAAPALAGQLAEENLTPDMIDLKNLPGAIAARRAGRNPLAAEITALKRQMTRLFPDYRCLRESPARPKRKAEPAA